MGDKSGRRFDLNRFGWLKSIQNTLKMIIKLVFMKKMDIIR